MAESILLLLLLLLLLLRPPGMCHLQKFESRLALAFIVIWE